MVHHKRMWVCMGKRQGTQAHKNKVDPACRSSSLKIKPSAIPTQTRHSRHNNRPNFIWYLVAILGKLALGLAVNLRTLLSLGEATASGLLALVVGLALDLATLLESRLHCPLPLVTLDLLADTSSLDPQTTLRQLGSLVFGGLGSSTAAGNTQGQQLTGFGGLGSSTAPSLGGFGATNNGANSIFGNRQLSQQP